MLLVVFLHAISLDNLQATLLYFTPSSINDYSMQCNPFLIMKSSKLKTVTKFHAEGRPRMMHIKQSLK